MPIVIYGKASLIACTDYLKKIIDLEKKKKKKVERVYSASLALCGKTNLASMMGSF